MFFHTIFSKFVCRDCMSQPKYFGNWGLCEVYLYLLKIFLFVLYLHFIVFIVLSNFLGLIIFGCQCHSNITKTHSDVARKKPEFQFIVSLLARIFKLSSFGPNWENVFVKGFRVCTKGIKCILRENHWKKY